MLLVVIGLPAWPGMAQYAPYQQRVYDQARREGERKLDSYLEQAYQPNFRSSVDMTGFNNYLNQLRTQAEAERRQRAEQRATTQANEALMRAEWARRSRELREQEERQAQLAQWADYQRRGLAGDAEASFAVARTLLKGHPQLPAGEATGFAAALPWFRRAARDGSAGAALRLALLLDEKDGARETSLEAYDLYRRAADLGESTAIPRAVSLAQSGGTGFVPDAAEAARLLRLGVQRRHPASLRAAALAMQEKPSASASELQQALNWLETAAAAGDLAANGRLALMWYDGRLGVKMDRARAVAVARQTLAKAPQFAPLENLLGRALMGGEGGEPNDPVRALEHFRRAAEQGDAAAASSLGFWFSVGVPGIKASRAESFRWRERAARLGSVSDALGLAGEYRSGADQNPARRLEFLELASRWDDGEGAYELARVLARGGAGIERKPTEARALARRSAEAAFPRGMALFGQLCLEGTGGNRDLAEAVRWTKAAAELGVAAAQRTWANLLFEGKGVPRDEAASVEWLRRAAARFDPEAMAQLAALHIEGGVCARDLAEARRWAEKSAMAGSALGQRFFAEFLRRGQGGPTNGPDAVRWHEAARAQGDAQSLLALAEIFRDGLPGVPADLKKARAYFDEATRTTEAEIISAARAALTQLDRSTSVSLDGLRIGPRPAPANPSLFEQLSLPSTRATNRTRLDQLKLD